MMSEKLDIDTLKIKPVPKKTTGYKLFLNEGLAPKIVDKTSEQLIDPLEFMSKINIGVVNKTEDFYKQKYKEKPIEKAIPEYERDIIINIVKTSKKIIIQEPILDDKGVPKMPSQKRFTEKPSKKPPTKKPSTIDDLDVDGEQNIGDTKIKDRLPPAKPNILIKADEYYLYNREKFISFINGLFMPYKDQLIQEEKDIAEGKITIDCNKSADNDFSLLVHQKIVRDYINLYTPYRGLLLYHGLGSGKTCSSIAIAEGIKNDKEVLIMTPASLRENYKQELKKCGDYLYKLNQYWEKISLEEIKSNPEYLKQLSSILKLPEEYITKNGGAWFINTSKQPNYESKSYEEKAEINNQVNKMIDYKYKFINYNGLRVNSGEWLSVTKNNTINPFSNKIVIVDEAHNLISRIVNKLKRPSALSMRIYHQLMDAENCKIILLTGTPIINYPNEIAILFNILRGYIKSFTFKLVENKKKYTQQALETLLKQAGIYNHIDYIEFNVKNKELKIYKNPFGFLHTDDRKKNKMHYSSDVDDLDTGTFIDNIIGIFAANNINFSNKPDDIMRLDKALPDILDDDIKKNYKGFKSYFIDDNNNFKNNEMFMRRILGLTSYFRSAQEQLMPDYSEDRFNVIEVLMSDFQFGVYEEARSQERKLEQNNKKKSAKKPTTGDNDIYNDSMSTYRIFSRAFCNFVFPRPDIKRPMPNKDDTIEATLDTVLDKENVNEDILDDIKPEEKLNDIDGKYDGDDLDDIKKDQADVKDDSYNIRIQKALEALEANSNKYLTREGLKMYSPKFLHILENVIDEDFKGIHLLYSQFKTLEGIGIFKLVLKQNGFAEFKIKKISNENYDLIIDEKDRGKPMFASYTGSELPEEREIIKNVLNSNWNLVPSSLITKIKEMMPSIQNNYLGEVIKILMITSSGAEGISLQNVRYVHIMEPYWHPVRIQQVIGRARRICSHSNLPKELQTVDVFLYLMKFTEEQLKSDKANELLKHDKSKFDMDPLTKQKLIYTSDEFLNELSNLKKKVTDEIFNNVKQSAIDCVIHSRSSSKEPIKCFLIGTDDKAPQVDTKLMYPSNILKQETDKALQLNKKTVGVKMVIPKYFKGTNYILEKGTEKVYDYDAYKLGQITYIGTVKLKEDGQFEIIKD